MRRHAILSLVLLVMPTLLAAQNLEIHVINVGWGQATFIKGPGTAGKTVLLEAGNTGDGTNEVVPYLKSIGWQPSNGFDYTVAGHQHCDHIGGMDEVINAGYNVRVKNYFNGNTSYASSCVDGWNTAAATTTAGTPAAMTVGTVIDLGGGAKLTCIAVNGAIIGGGSVSVSNENDKSIALLLEYGGFDYFWASDLGGGADDFDCTGRSTTQMNVETPLMQAISPGGAYPLISSGGIDVLHVSHHGSESSTNNDLFDYSVPAVAVISTGAGQASNWHLPRIDVVERVLLAQATACVTAPPTFVLQTEEGAPTGSQTSFAGYCVGDIVISTDGASLFTVSANGSVNQGPNEVGAAGLPKSFTIDDLTDTQAPTTSITSPLGGSIVSGTILVTASASDNVGVTQVEFYLDGALKSTDTVSPYEWSWDTKTVANGSHSLTSKAYDAAGNAGTSAAVSVTVDNDTTAPTTSITAPAAGATVSGTTLVTASASDNVGVTKVEFYLDGVFQASDTTSPYEWSWNTTTSSNGSHSLSSKAYDAAGNVGTSAAVSVTVSNPSGTDISGWKLYQANASYTYTFASGTVIPDHGYLIIARNATKTEFETFWGVTLATNVVYINSAGTMPLINGDEKYALDNSAAVRIDGWTIAMSSSAGKSIQRNDPCASAGEASSWNVVSASYANPGSGAAVGCAKGLVVNEFSDALGTGNYIYEFVELHNDK